MDWLDRFLYKDIPAGSIVGFHRYPNGRDTQKPHNGFQSRSHEWNRLQALAGGHKLFLTETGLSQGPHRIKRPFPLCWLNENHWISQEEQAAAMALEWAIWEPRGVLGMTWYQHRDGNYYQDLLNNYGIYAADGNEKAIVETFKNILL
ncbi:hypothetical protein GTO27_06875 [Candidatus Bathyarchaeota archaeon]|nr:hypothetical protein [Candidatus Bathyarchaeota archaeon]